MKTYSCARYEDSRYVHGLTKFMCRFSESFRQNDSLRRHRTRLVTVSCAHSVSSKACTVHKKAIQSSKVSLRSGEPRSPPSKLVHETAHDLDLSSQPCIRSFQCMKDAHSSRKLMRKKRGQRAPLEKTKPTPQQRTARKKQTDNNLRHTAAPAKWANKVLGHPGRRAKPQSAVSYTVESS
jgi:hypothetical protein